MAAYTLGVIGGINPEVSMPDLTVNDTPAEIDRKLDRYFNAENLSPSVQAMLKGQQLTPGEYAEGLKQYARAVIFTTQTDGSA
jgi:heat shock protein HspQ